jgi:hypothetical protein
MRTIYPSVIKKPEVVNELRRLHNFVLVPVYEASKDIVFVCKNYYYECLLNELGCDWSTGDATRDAYSSMTPDPTSDIFKGLCTPIL